MPVDYDAPRTRTEDTEPETIEEVTVAQARVAARQSADTALEIAELESFELPGADLSDQSLVIEVTPQQADEFTCLGCFLVRHRAQLRDSARGLCLDCA
jgi:hypothetical protein